MMEARKHSAGCHFKITMTLIVSRIGIYPGGMRPALLSGKINLLLSPLQVLGITELKVHKHAINYQAVASIYSHITFALHWLLPCLLSCLTSCSWHSWHGGMFSLQDFLPLCFLPLSPLFPLPVVCLFLHPSLTLAVSHHFPTSYNWCSWHRGLLSLFVSLSVRLPPALASVSHHLSTFWNWCTWHVGLVCLRCGPLSLIWAVILEDWGSVFLFLPASVARTYLAISLYV